MSVLLQRATLLFEQERYDASIDALRQHLAADPQNAFAHRLLALCLIHQGQMQPATEHARQAIGIEPAEPFSHYTLAAVLFKRNHFAEAQAATEQALALAPSFVDAYALLAQLHFAQKHWQQTLDAANRGLAFDAEDTSCLNLRAMAEVKLGRTKDAAATLSDTLRRNPDNARAHANQGWVCLEQGDSKQAIVHFKEALRLEPDLDYARAGIVEALKARNFVYRWVLYYFLWMAKFSSTAQWMILLGGFFGFSFVSKLAREQPELWPYLMPLIVAYTVFALLTWLASPLFNLFLRVHPLGKYAISNDQKRGANLLLGGLLLTALVLGLGLAFSTTALALQAALFTVLIVLPSSMIYNCDEGWPRLTAWSILAALAVLGLPLIVALMFQLPPERLPVLMVLLVLVAARGFVWAAIAAQFAMNYLAAQTVRK